MRSPGASRGALSALSRRTCSSARPESRLRERCVSGRAVSRPDGEAALTFRTVSGLARKDLAHVAGYPRQGLTRSFDPFVNTISSRKIGRWPAAEADQSPIRITQPHPAIYRHPRTPHVRGLRSHDRARPARASWRQPPSRRYRGGAGRAVRPAIGRTASSGATARGAAVTAIRRQLSARPQSRRCPRKSGNSPPSSPLEAISIRPHRASHF